jgi:acid phosphatase family membrane protein YuiD
LPPVNNDYLCIVTKQKAILMESGIIFGNKVLDVVTIAWFLAQFYNVINSLIIDKKVLFKRMWETGGMPSSHSASVTSLATAVGITHGFSSTLFAIVAIFAVIVMHDAAGIRLAAGKQAGVLNKITRSLNQLLENKLHQENLRELLGHTRIEVLVGALLGIMVAYLMKFYLQG